MYDNNKNITVANNIFNTIIISFIIMATLTKRGVILRYKVMLKIKASCFLDHTLTVVVTC